MVYGVSLVYSVFLWRKGFRRDDHVNFFLLLLGFAGHTTAMVLRGFSLKQCPVNNLFEATIFLAWALALACLIVCLLPQLRFVSAFASPVLFTIGVFALMPSLDPPHGPKPEFSHGLQSLHAASILLAYGSFGLGSISAIMFLTQQHNLKFNKLKAVLSLLPPIQRLEIVTQRLVLVGFVLLTLGLSAGGHLPRPEGVKYWRETKVVWSALLWAAYLGLLVARWRFNFAGRRFACGVIGIFAFLLLTFWGTNLLSTLHQQHP
ncbi:MAG: cytochrome c assembly protein [Verrucomicrobia bacterium]|nr:MAG: cytochrome c assembly protein [Verrucomicrobiota bacterium]